MCKNILFPIPSHYTCCCFFGTDKWPVSRVSWWDCPMSHHVTFVTGMRTSLFWTVHCGAWVGCIVGFEGLFYSVWQHMDSYFWLSNTSLMYPYCLFPTMHAAHAIVYLLFVLVYCFMCLPIALKLYLFFPYLIEQSCHKARKMLTSSQNSTDMISVTRKLQSLDLTWRVA